jgi:hypothetical protein
MVRPPSSHNLSALEGVCNSDCVTSLMPAAKSLLKKAFSCHSEACFSPKNLSVDLTYIEERFFASLRMTQKRMFFRSQQSGLMSAACGTAEACLLAGGPCPTKREAPRHCRGASPSGTRRRVDRRFFFAYSAMKSVEPLRFTRNSGLAPALRTASRSSATLFTG